MSFLRMMSLASRHSPCLAPWIHKAYVFIWIQLEAHPTQGSTFLLSDTNRSSSTPHPQGAKGVTLPLTSGQASSHTDSASLGLLSCEIFN